MSRMNTKSPEMGEVDAAISVQLVAVKTEGMESKKSVYDTVVRSLLWATVILLPLWYLPWTSSVLEYNKQMLLVAVSAVGLVAWLLGVVANGKLTVRMTPIDKGILALLVASGIATILSMTPVRSVFGTNASLSTAFLTTLALSVFYFLAVNVFHDRGRTIRFAMLVSIALVLLVGVLQMFGIYVLPGAFTSARAFNTIGLLNALGVLAAIALPLFAKAMESNTGGKFSSVLAITGTVLTIGVITLLNWWVLWVIALAGMLAMIAFDSLNITQLSEDYGKKKNRFALSRFMVPTIVIVVGVFMLLMNVQLSSWKAKLPTEVAPSFKLSMHVAGSVLKSKPVAGWGPENFSLAFDRFGAGRLANTTMANARFSDATGEVFSLVVQGGAVAILALLVLLWCLLQVIRRFGGTISEAMTKGERAVFAAQSSGTIAATVAATVALFLYPFSLSLWFVFVVLLVLVALIVAGDRSRTVDIEERPLYSLAASLGFIVGLILVLSGTYLASMHYLADIRYAHALTQTKPSDVTDKIIRAINLDPSNDQYLRDASQAALAMVREEIGTKDADAQRVQNLIASAVQLAQRATTVQPNDAANWSNLGQVYQSLVGIIDNVGQLSQDAYMKAGELRPGDPTFDNSIGQMWLGWSNILQTVIRQSTGDTVKLQQQSTDAITKAEEAFKRAIEKSNTYGIAIYNLGAVYDRQGKVKEAIAQLEKIVPYNANEPTLMFELGLLYVRDGRKANAIGAFQRAVLLTPQYANARWYLALLLEDKGDITGALTQLQEIQKSNPDNAALQQKISQLEAGKRAIPPGKVIDSKPLQ